MSVWTMDFESIVSTVSPSWQLNKQDISCRERGLNPHAPMGQGILSPLRLPFPSSRLLLTIRFSTNKSAVYHIINSLSTVSSGFVNFIVI